MSNWKFFILSNSDGSYLECKSPVGWDDTGISLLRNSKYFGTFTSITVDFEFIHDGYNYILDQYLRFGIDADLDLMIYSYGRFVYKGKLNFEDFENDMKVRKFKTDLIESSFMQKFLNRDDIEFNILSNETIDGISVNPPFLFDGKLRNKVIQFYTETEAVPDNPQYYHHSVPFRFIVNDNPQMFEPFGVVTDIDTSALRTPENAFYHNIKSVQQRVKFTIYFEVSLTWESDVIDQLPGRGDTTNYGANQTRFFMQRYNEEGEFVESLLWDDHQNILLRGFYGTWTGTWEVDTILDPGDFLIFDCHRERPSGTAYGNQNFGEMDDFYRTRIDYGQVDIIMTEESDFEDTTTKTILPHDLFETLITHMTGKKFSLVSNIFGRTDLLDENGNKRYETNGEWAFLGISHGKQVRGFEVTEIATSFEDAFKSYSSKIALGMKVIGETVYIDPIEDLFSNEVILDLGEVNELNISPASEFYFNEVQIGDPEIEFEEVNGLDEYNTKATYINDLKTYANKLELISKYTASCYAREFARRQQASIAGTEDTKYDEMIMMTMFILDEDGFLISERLENGITVQEGTILSPETAGNLRLAPSQCFSRWKKYLGIPLVKNNNTYFYQSKAFNSDLVVQTEEEGQTFEGENITLAGEHLFYPEIRSFSIPVTHQIINTIKNNPLGLIKYQYKGRIFLDYLFEINAEIEKDRGNFRMLAARPMSYRKPIDFTRLPILKYSDGPEEYVLHGDNDNDFLLYE